MSGLLARLTAVAGAVSVLAMAPVSATAFNPPSAEVAVGFTTDYYSDATYSVQVGAVVRNCHGIYRWGQITEWSITTYDEPC